MKKIRLGVMGFVAVALICAGCNDSGIANGNEEAGAFLKSLYEGTTDEGGSGSYETVIIGGKTWMKKNLNIEFGNSWCYGNSADSCKKYGRLYDWQTATKVCPSRWHLPISSEWDALVIEVGGLDVAGKKLKSPSGWHDKGNGTDDFGFSALPSGNRDFNGGGCYNAGLSGSWWTATESNSDFAYYRNVQFIYDDIFEYNSHKSYGYSVRCVQNN